MKPCQCFFFWRCFKTNVAIFKTNRDYRILTMNNDTHMTAPQRSMTRAKLTFDSQSTKWSCMQGSWERHHSLSRAVAAALAALIRFVAEAHSACDEECWKNPKKSRNYVIHHLNSLLSLTIDPLLIFIISFGVVEQLVVRQHFSFRWPFSWKEKYILGLICNQS